MFTTGMTSVTFRRLSKEEIARLVKEAGLQGIEWGGDVHLPPGDMTAAADALKITRDCGLKVLSYGSYYRLGEGSDFLPVLKTARAIGAPVIRIWAGTRGSDRIGDEKEAEQAYLTAAEETVKLCRMAADYGIQVAFEYHPGTLTDNADSALRLLYACGDCVVKTYWQPRPVSSGENVAEIRKIKDYLLYTHVFHWTPEGGQLKRHMLQDGEKDWKIYLDALKCAPGEKTMIMEFVKDDSPGNFLKDAATLLSWEKSL